MNDTKQPLKIVYVLVSDECDFFYEQLLISVMSLKKVMPYVWIELIVDDVTMTTLSGYRGQIKNIVNSIKVQYLEKHFDKQTRSRILKITMRSIINGNFLYLDCDTIICEDLSEIVNISQSSAVLDNHMRVSKKIKEFEPVMKRARTIGYSVGYTNCHFNSGVLWCKDDKSTHDFFDMWEKLWHETYEEGYKIDQLSFNEANYRLNGVFLEMSGNWNCQLRYGLPFLSSAKILHYFASNINNSSEIKFAYYFTNNLIFKEIRREKVITENAYQIIDSPKSAFEKAYLIGISSIDYQVITSKVYKVLRYIYKKALFRNRIMLLKKEDKRDED